MTRSAALHSKLKDKRYRDEYVSAHIHTGLAFQIRALREQRKWSQETLGTKIKQSQPGVSRLETPGHPFTLNTLKKLASAFDVALVVRFVPFSELATWTQSLSPGSLEVPAFADDPGFEERPSQSLTVTARRLRLSEITTPVGIQFLNARRVAPPTAPTRMDTLCSRNFLFRSERRTDA